MGVGLAFATVPTMPLMKAMSRHLGPSSSNYVSATFSAATSLGEMVGPALGGVMVKVMSQFKDDDDDKKADQYGWRWTTTYYAEGCLLFVGVLFVSQACMTLPIERASARCPSLCVVVYVVAAAVLALVVCLR